MDEKLTFFTVVARNYLAQAYTVADSVKKYHPNSNFYIFLMDDISHNYASEIQQRGFTAIYPEQIDIQEYKQFVFKYNIVEACTAVKPFIMKFLLTTTDVEKLIYIDPDILCFRRLDEVINLLDTYHIIITPHSLSSIPEHLAGGDRFFLSVGAYNLGFIALDKSSETQKFVDWFIKQLWKNCLQLPEINFFVDQKWVDLVPCYFDGVYILRSLAYNIAYWNMHERTLNKGQENYYVVQSGEPVAFIHYSSIDINKPEKVSKSISMLIPHEYQENKEKYSDIDDPVIVELWQHYANLLKANNYSYYSKISYGFLNYENGETISQLERYLFLVSSIWQQPGINPFEMGESSFGRFCRRLGINSKQANSRMLLIPEVKQKYKNYTFVLKLTQLAIKLMIKIFGVDKYSLFAMYVTKQFLLVKHEFLLKEKSGH